MFSHGVAYLLGEQPASPVRQFFTHFPPSTSQLMKNKLGSGVGWGVGSGVGAAVVGSFVGLGVVGAAVVGD